MGRLVREEDGEIQVANVSVHAPTYTMLVADGVSGNGWTYYADDVQSDEFITSWYEPAQDSTGYARLAYVKHNGKKWINQVADNVREPGVSGWSEADNIIPQWVQPLGAHDAYRIESVVMNNGQFWRALVDYNVWEPPINWREVLIDLSTPAQWIQPSGAGDAYPLGARVTHELQTWESTVAANVWEPGVFGWVVY